MIKDLFDYFGSYEEAPTEVIKIEAQKVEVVAPEPILKDEDYYDADGYENADGDDFYDADGDYSEARGKRKRNVKRKRMAKRTTAKRKPMVKRKPMAKRKPTIPVNTSHTTIVTLGSNPQAAFTKKVMKALDGDQFFNAGGRGGGHRGGGGRRGGGFHRGGRPIFRGGGGYFWNGAYWVDGGGLCYTKDLLGNYTLVDCGVIPSVAFGL
jgi:hypothetical protein